MLNPPSDHLEYAKLLIEGLELAAKNIGQCKGNTRGWCPDSLAETYEQKAKHFEQHLKLHAPRFSGRGWRAVRSLVHRVQKTAYYRAKWGEQGCWQLESVEEARSTVHNLLAKYIINT